MRGDIKLKRNLTLVIASLISILLMTFHLTQDTLHARAGTPEAGGSTLVAVPVLVLWLYGTLMLGERWSGQIIMFVGSLLDIGMAILHVRGAEGFFHGQFVRYSGAFLFFWTLMALSIIGMLSLILSVQGLWSLKAGPPSPAR